jgi:hypothetical protein
MRKVAIRKALPHIDETDFDINDIKSIRMLPSTHLPTVSKPLPWNTAQSSIDWENRIRDKGNLERIPLPTSELGGVGAEGTWVSPALQEAFATPDVTINPHVASTIVGILNGVPNWWRTPRQGSRAGGVGEGFHFGGFPQDSFVRLTDTDINPLSIERALSPLAAETPFRNRVRNLVSQFPSYEEEGVSPEQAASLVWGKQPTNLTVNPLQDKTGGARKIASEPMDIAFQLLKERVSPEAKRHKLEYDKKYESSPERIKYREQLNQERRKRGIYGSHDHKDISHTEGGKLTLEGEHENRARHFREKGTLRPN